MDMQSCQKKRIPYPTFERSFGNAPEKFTIVRKIHRENVRTSEDPSLSGNVAQAITHSRQQLVTEHLTTDLTNSRLAAGRDAWDHHTAEPCCESPPERTGRRRSMPGSPLDKTPGAMETTSAGTTTPFRVTVDLCQTETYF
ncbi:unnamed protein product [Boreogadus saida]